MRVPSSAPYIFHQRFHVLLITCELPTLIPVDGITLFLINRSQKNSNVGNINENLVKKTVTAPNSNTIERDPTKDKYSKVHIVNNYTQELGESVKKICRKYGILTHFKGNSTIKEMLVKTKDKDPLDKMSGAISWYQCRKLMCDEEVIGETSRTFGERYKEHLKELSPIYGYSNQSGHNTNPENFTYPSQNY